MLHCLKVFQPLTVRTVQITYKHCLSLKSYSKSSNTENEISIEGLAEALGKFRELEKPKTEVKREEKHESFLHLLRHSEFVQMGDPNGKIVIGKIFQVVNTDLYIDFGGKFYCVCRRPKRDAEMYVRNAKVKLRLNEMELCARFLGATEDLTLTEASATLLDLVWTPLNSKKEISKETKA